MTAKERHEAEIRKYTERGTIHCMTIRQTEFDTIEEAISAPCPTWANSIQVKRYPTGEEVFAFENDLNAGSALWMTSRLEVAYFDRSQPDATPNGWVIRRRRQVAA